MKPLVFTLHFLLMRFRGNILIKIVINTITQIQDKKANATQDQLEFER